MHPIKPNSHERPMVILGQGDQERRIEEDDVEHMFSVARWAAACVIGLASVVGIIAGAGIVLALRAIL